MFQVKLGSESLGLGQEREVETSERCVVCCLENFGLGLEREN